MNKKSSLIRRILSNNKVVFVISLFLAVAVWLVIALQFSDQQIATFDVPVDIDMTMADSLELQRFGKDELTVSVKVSGKRYEVSSKMLSKDDFLVTASTVNVSSAGKHSLPVSVRLNNDNRDIEIVSFSPESLDVYFDYSLTETYPIVVEISKPEDGIAADGYISGEPLVSSTEVTVSGAAAEIQKIHEVKARVTVDAPLTETTKFENVSLSIVNSNNGIVRSSYFKYEDDLNSVTVTVPILKVMQFTPSVKFKNTPAYFTDHPINYICAPSGTVKAAISTELLSSTDSLSLGIIDFADIKLGTNLFVYKSADIPYIRILDDVDEFRVYFSIEGFQSRTFTVKGGDILFNALPDGVRASIAEETKYPVTVIGLKDEIESLTAEQITASVDADGLVAQTEPYSLPITFTLDGTTSCWVSGKVSADVTVS